MDPIGIILSWLTLGASVLYIAYEWLLVIRQRRLKPSNAAGISLGTGLLIVALPMTFYSNLSTDALNQILLIGAGCIIGAFFIGFRNKREETKEGINTGSGT